MQCLMYRTEAVIAIKGMMYFMPLNYLITTVLILLVLQPLTFLELL